tara:strand:+ start:16163 stop:17605 length:1443 start_codon:yes stop_codon:yes gene_type:complete
MKLFNALLSGALLLCFSATTQAATCALAGDTVIEPTGGFIHTLYNVDFETPTHTAGSWPVEGLGPKEVGLYQNYNMSIAESHKGLPEVVVQPLLDSQSAELNARPINTDRSSYDDILFQLGRGADYYSIDFDLVVDEHVNLTRTGIKLSDMSDAGCYVIFNAANEIFIAGLRASYAFDTRYHISITLLPNGDETGRLFFTIGDATSTLYSAQFDVSGSGNDFGSLMLRAQGYEDPDNNYAQVDNVVIRAAYTDVPTLPPADVDDNYVLDFNNASAPAPSGIFWIEDGFALLFGDSNNNVYSADNSVAMRFPSSSRPTLMHQLSLPFTLKQLELGEYSTGFSARTTTFTGYKYDGTEVTRDFTTDGLADGTGGINDMELVTFDDSWTNLRAIQFGGSASIDNVVLSVNTDIDADNVHDWLDACLPEQAAGAAVENAVERESGCPPRNTANSGGSNSGGGAGWLLSLLALSLVGLRRKNVTA